MDFSEIGSELKWRLGNEYSKVKAMWAGGNIQPDTIIQLYEKLHLSY